LPSGKGVPNKDRAEISQEYQCVFHSACCEELRCHWVVELRGRTTRLALRWTASIQSERGRCPQGCRWEFVAASAKARRIVGRRPPGERPELEKEGGRAEVAVSNPGASNAQERTPALT
jgi:hypothetical protein